MRRRQIIKEHSLELNFFHYQKSFPFGSPIVCWLTRAQSFDAEAAPPMMDEAELAVQAACCSKSTHQLLTSDRPINMPLGLADPEAYISLPVSPRELRSGVTSRAVSPDRQSHGCDQSDPR